MCMGPSDPHPNWHLGMRGTQHRAVFWRVWKEGGTGFLYWGANCYEKALVPSAEVCAWPHGCLSFKNTISVGAEILCMLLSRLDLGVAFLLEMEFCSTLVKCSPLHMNQLLQLD